jgi:hypothetical protein
LIIINSQRPFNHVTENGKINVGETNEIFVGSAADFVGKIEAYY